jgi:hypothetical protein
MHKRFLFIQINTAAFHLQTRAVFDTVNTTNASSYGPFLRWWHLQTAAEWPAWCGIKALKFWLCEKGREAKWVENLSVDPDRDAQIFQQSRSHIKILGARRVTWGKFRADDTWIFSTTRENLFTLGLWTARSRSVFNKKYMAEKSSSVTPHHIAPV